MKINFGIIKKYFTDRGFGFVASNFPNPHSKEVFFHIKTIQQSNLELAKKISNEDFTKGIYFWYETESSKKGEQVCTVLNSESIHQKYSDDLPEFIKKVESIWNDIDSQIPEWLVQISIDLVGADRTKELELKRMEANEKKYKVEENLKKIETSKVEKSLTQEEIEMTEFKELIEELLPLGFTQSSEVSSYIIKNQLGYKYKNISGIIEMELEGTTWKFKGGFPTKIYARLCSELGLKNKGSDAKVVGFNSFKEEMTKEIKVTKRQTIFNGTEEEIEADIMAQEIHREELAKHNEYRLEVNQAMQEAQYEKQEEFKFYQELERLGRLKNFI